MKGARKKKGLAICVAICVAVALPIATVGGDLDDVSAQPGVEVAAGAAGAGAAGRDAPEGSGGSSGGGADVSASPYADSYEPVSEMTRIGPTLARSREGIFVNTNGIIVVFRGSCSDEERCEVVEWHRSATYALDHVRVTLLLLDGADTDEVAWHFHDLDEVERVGRMGFKNPLFRPGVIMGAGAGLTGRGAVCVAAAGNDGDSLLGSQANCPASCFNVVSVGALSVWTPAAMNGLYTTAEYGYGALDVAAAVGRFRQRVFALHGSGGRLLPERFAGMR